MMNLLSERSRVFDRADAYAVSEYVNQHVGTHCIRLPARGRPAASINHRTFASLDLCRISYGGAVRVTSAALESSFHLQILLRGQCRSQVAGHNHIYVPGEMLLINPHDPVDLTYSADCEKFILKLPVPLLESVCLAQHWRVPSEGIRFQAARHDLTGLGSFLSLLGLVCQEAEGEANACDTAPGLYERIVASKLLNLLGNNLSQAAIEVPCRLDAIRGYIDAHLTEEITVRQLMAAGRVSERSLYTLFERHLGIGPQDYIRRCKLEQVHAQLAGPAARSVTEVALDYGFSHLGRFAQAYRQRFGELPSHTWKRHRTTRLAGENQAQNG